MDLVLWFFILISSYNFCSSAIVTRDEDRSIFEELMKVGVTAEPFVQFHYEKKQRICKTVLHSSYFRNIGWEYLEKSEAYADFSWQYQYRVSDHYDERNINECFVVKNQRIAINFPDNVVELPSFGCLAEDKSIKSRYREIFVSYGRIKNTYIISTRNHPRYKAAIPEYFGIVELLPALNYLRVVPDLEEYFRSDYNQPGDTEERINKLSRSKRNRLCKIAIHTKDENIGPDGIRTAFPLRNVRVNLTEESLFIDAVLPCSFPVAEDYHYQYLVLSKTDRSMVYILKQQDNSSSTTLELTGYFVAEIPTLNEGYDISPNDER